MIIKRAKKARNAERNAWKTAAKNDKTKTVADEGTISKNRKPLKLHHGKEDEGRSGKNDYIPVKEPEEKKGEEGI